MTNLAATYTIGNPALYAKILREAEHDAYRNAFRTLHAIEEDLNNRFARMAEPIHALIISALIGEPLLYVGDPGTGKSLLIRCFCQYIGAYPLKKENTLDHPNYFEYLLTPFTEPGELFGYYEIVEEGGKRKIARDKYPIGMMQSAKVVYIDEVFNGSSAILNSMLAFMNERRFHDRGKFIKVNMEAMYGATNQVPETSELRAIYDRFFLRCVISNIEIRDVERANKSALQELLEKGWSESYDPAGTMKLEPVPKLLQTLKEFREDIGANTTGATLFGDPRNQGFIQELNRMIEEIRRRELSKMSNRRIVKFVNMILMHAIYDAVIQKKPKVEITQRQMSLWRFILDRRDDSLEVHLRRKYSDPDFLPYGN